MNENNKTLVLVTGGSGFIGVQCIAQLLNQGYGVRTTVRSLAREADVREMLKKVGVDAGDRLSFLIADLLSDAGWPEAVAGCEYVLHVASPFMTTQPKDENELIIPAREGTLRVLRAARDAGVKRVVVTSSVAAVSYGSKEHDAPYTEEDWTDPNEPGINAYVKSKTLAERAAWDFIAKEGNALELSVVNPVAVFGPALTKDYSPSIQFLKNLLDGGTPGMANAAFGIVDVRDVADLHVRAMINPAAKGERFIAVAGDSMSMRGMTEVLKRWLQDIAVAAQIPAQDIPAWTVRVGALLDTSLSRLGPDSGKLKKISNEKARRVLDWSPRTNEEAIMAAAESLISLGLI